MVLLDDDDLVDRCVLLRRWGRRSEPQFYGSKKGDKRFFSEVPDGAHRVRQPVHLRRGGLELRAVRDQRRVRAGAAAQAAGEPRAAPAQLRLLSAFFGTYPTCSCCRAPSTARDRVAHVPGPDPAGVGYPPGRLPGAHGGARHRHAHGVDGQRHPAARVREGAAPRPRWAARTPTG